MNISTFHLEGSYAALEALNAEHFADLRANDEEIQRCFVAAAARCGMVVSGYSGRDDNVIADHAPRGAEQSAAV